MTMLGVGTRSQLGMSGIAQAGEYGLIMQNRKDKISSEIMADVSGVGLDGIRGGY
jgi:hypothetical protein